MIELWSQQFCAQIDVDPDSANKANVAPNLPMLALTYAQKIF